jgi:hypothetical protein
MIFSDIAGLRLINQQIAGTGFGTVKEIVTWMGAMQAQDYAMVKWAIGVRLPDSTEQVIETAIDNREIIRTHLLRPTWHFVSADDIYWMLALTAPRIKASMKSRHQELGLSETVVTQSNDLIEKALGEAKSLTREELIVLLKNAGIATDANRMSHLLARAELDGIVCSGPIKSGKQTYALLEERVPKTKSLMKDEALATLAKKYFASRGPATLQDFVWWSGLSVSDAKHAVELVKSDFISETIASQTYWFTGFNSMPGVDKDAVYLLPAFDEFIISYKDRSASLPFENHKKTVSDNGIFRPVIVVNGQVMGIWKRALKRDRVIVETELFTQPDKIIVSLIEKSLAQYGHFLEKETEINHKF